MARSWWWLCGVLASVGCAGSCAQAPQVLRDERCVLVETGFGPAGKTRVRAAVVAQGLEVPWALAFLPGGDVLVTERPGRVRLIRDGVLRPAPVAVVPTVGGGESGLLGLVLHPRFEETRAFFVYVRVSARENRVERWRLSDDGTSARFERVVFGGIRAADTHDGGRLRIGPDGMLYVGTGDTRDAPRSQDPSRPEGKLLRLTLDGEVPGDNPLRGNPAFVTGIRNTQGFDWLDEKTLVLVDHGPSGDQGRTGQDELNVVRAGEDLGWPTVSGCDVSGRSVAPRLTFRGAAPPGGLAIYRGSAFPEWRGDVFFGVLGSRHLHRVTLDERRDVRAHEVYFEGNPPEGLGRLREVINGPDGELWVTTSNCDGRGTCGPEKDQVLRLVPAE